jgi:hypothetical protein
VADPYNPNITSREKLRVGGDFSVARGMVSVEFYSSVEHYPGDPYGRHLDADLHANYKLWDWISKDKKNTVDITASVYSTEMFGWVNRGYELFPISAMLTVNVKTPTFIGFGSGNAVYVPRKTHEGLYDKVATTPYLTPATWEGISIGVNGGANQSTKTVKAAGTEEAYVNPDPNDLPSITINAGDVSYMKRELVLGGIGEGALTAWHSGGAGPANMLFLKSVKLMDKVHGKIYGLDTSGQWVELTGTQPVTAPDLTAAHVYFDGGAQAYTLPEELWTGQNIDGRMNVSAIVEYGADTSKIPNNKVFKQYNGAGTLVWDPAWTIAEVYANGVKWAGYHNTDPDRTLVDSYDPTLPYDPDTNDYYASLKKLAPINLDVTLKY